MRKSLEELIETCFDIKVHLKVSGFIVKEIKDGAYALFKVPTIDDPKTLIRIIGKLKFDIFAENQDVIICVFEDYQEY